jgi:hypothetical protein
MTDRLKLPIKSDYVILCFGHLWPLIGVKQNASTFITTMPVAMDPLLLVLSCWSPTHGVIISKIILNKLTDFDIFEHLSFNENHKSIAFVRNLSCLYCTQYNTTLHVSAIQPH